MISTLDYDSALSQLARLLPVDQQQNRATVDATLNAIVRTVRRLNVDDAGRLRGDQPAEAVTAEDAAAALFLLNDRRHQLIQQERLLIEAAIDRGLTFGQLGALYGGRSRQGMRSYYREQLGGTRTWQLKGGAHLGSEEWRTAVLWVRIAAKKWSMADGAPQQNAAVQQLTRMEQIDTIAVILHKRWLTEDDLFQLPIPDDVLAKATAEAARDGYQPVAVDEKPVGIADTDLGILTKAIGRFLVDHVDEAGGGVSYPCRAWNRLDESQRRAYLDSVMP